VWLDPPPNTKQFALTMEDPDAPGKTFTHWMVYGIPADTPGLPEGLAKDPQLPDGIRQGKNDFGTIGYAGPDPPPGASHRYIFQIYALNSIINLKPAATRREFHDAIKNQTLKVAKLVGTYGAAAPVPEPMQSTGSEAPQPVPDTAGEVGLPGSAKARLRELNADKEFLIRTADRQKELSDAYKQNPDAVQEFFKRFSLTSSFGEAKVRDYLAEIDDQTLRRAFENYVSYANRFRVSLRLRTSPLEFRVSPWMPPGNKFHVKIVGDHLEGAGETPDWVDAYAESFPAPSMDVPPAIQDLIHEGKATFVRVDDHGGYSMLKGLEDFAYKDDGVAIIHHDAEQPYLICIFGEKMTKETLADLGKAVTEFQQEHFHRSRGGRPPKLDRLKKRLEVDAKPISNKEKAAELAEGEGEKKIKVEEVNLSRLRAKRRKTER
jgi:Raf kinase inhibitor-like YbhB/YbcL family protein